MGHKIGNSDDEYLDTCWCGCHENEDGSDKEGVDCSVCCVRVAKHECRNHVISAECEIEWLNDRIEELGGAND
jgi:hypothetical protein